MTENKKPKVYIEAAAPLTAEGIQKICKVEKENKSLSDELKSIGWHFSEEQPNIPICNICNKSIPEAISTNDPLIKHLQICIERKYKEKIQNVQRRLKDEIVENWPKLRKDFGTGNINSIINKIFLEEFGRKLI